MKNLLNRKTISRISMFCLYNYLNLLFINAEEDSFEDSRNFANNKTYLLTWNSLAVQNIGPFYDYCYNYNNPPKGGKANHIVPKVYELVRLFFNFSFSKTKWRNTHYGFFYKINALENFYSCFNLRQLVSKKIRYEHEYIGIAAFYVGINVSYNNNGMMAKNKVNVGGKFGLGLMWSRFFWLLLYNYKNISKDKILEYELNEYFSRKKKPKNLGKEHDWLFKKNVSEILNLSNVLKNWENWVNFDVVFDIIPFYIQFKKILYINVEYKLGLMDTIRSVIKHRKLITKKKERDILRHLLYNMSINIGIY